MNHYDLAYSLALGITAPVWAIMPRARRKVTEALRLRMARELPERDVSFPGVMIHAVSLGELNAARALIDRLRAARPELHLIISTTTATGFDRARALYADQPRISLIRYPLDFSGPIHRLIDRLIPQLVVLMELEVWPNFLHICAQRNVKVAVVNGRLTSRSFRRYRRVRPLIGSMFRKLSLVCTQDPTYARRFIELGVAEERVAVTGTMKFDTAAPDIPVTGAQALAEQVGLKPGTEMIWVCGSTGPGEEQIILDCYRRLLRDYPRLRLVMVPRHPQRFDEVAEQIVQHRFPVVRRSQGAGPDRHPPLPPVVLGDTMGELRTFYALADYVFVGRSLVDLGVSQHGSDMIEPAALGKPVIVGPYTANFAEVMNHFRQAEAIWEVEDGPSLEQALRVLISTPHESASMGLRARHVVETNRGATERNLVQILKLLDT